MQVARDAARRAEIVEAAKACFLRYGYGKTSLDDIAREAKLSRPLLYRKFANKEAIFSAVYDAVFTTHLENARALVAGKGSTAAKLVAVCNEVCVAPYALLHGKPSAEEFYAACEAVIPAILEAHDRKWRALLAGLLAKPLIEVFGLALDGLHADKPPPATLKKRIVVLVGRFT